MRPSDSIVLGDYPPFSQEKPVRSGKARAVHTSIKVHHAPGGRSQCPFGTEFDLDPVSTPKKRSNSSQMEQLLSTPVNKNLYHQSAPISEPEPKALSFGKSRPDQHTSIRIHHAPGGQSSISLGEQNEDKYNIIAPSSYATESEIVIDEIPGGTTFIKADYYETAATGARLNIGSEPVTGSRPCTKVHHAPGGRSSGNIISWQ